MSAKLNSGTMTGLVFARLAAEVASEAGAGGLTHGYKNLLREPYDATIAYLRDQVILPDLEKYEATIEQYLPGMVTLQDKINRQTQTREQRAEKIATATLHLSTDFIGGFFAQVYGQKIFDKVFKAPHISDAEQYKVAFADRVIQLGGFVTLNTAAVKQNHDMQTKLADLFEKLLSPWGVTREQAEDYSKTTVNARLPNLIGLIGSLFVHNHYSK